MLTDSLAQFKGQVLSHPPPGVEDGGQEMVGVGKGGRESALGWGVG